MSEGLAGLGRLARIVADQGACELPGISIDAAAFVQIMRRAVRRGEVCREHAEFVEMGLRFQYI